MTPYATYVAEANQLDYVVPFPFLHRSHVIVRVNGVLQSLSPWPGPGTLRLLLKAPTGAFVEIERVTPLEGPLVQFQNGSVLTSEDLNTAILQLLYRQQELAALYERAIDKAKVRLGEAGGIAVPSDQVIDELVQHVLQMEVVNHLLSRLGELDQNAEAILAESAARIAELEATRDAFNARLEDELGTIGTLIETERTERINGDEALAQQITTVAAKSDDALAGILQEATARADADSAFAQLLNLLTARVGSAEAAIQSMDTVEVNQDEALAESVLAMVTSWGLGRASFVRDIKLHSDELSSQASKIEVLQADFDDVSAAVISEQTARADADEALATTLTAVQAEVDDAQALIASEQSARATADEALASQIDSVSATVDDHTALISTESIARATEDEALATRVDGVVATITDLDTELTAAITSEQTARVDADGALGSRIDAVVAVAGSNSALIAAEQTARADGDSANASAIQAVSTTVGNHTASIGTIQSSVNGLQLKHGVKLNSNGHITGFEQNNNGTSGDFTVVADVFKVVMPGTTTPIMTPFTVTGGGVRIDGNLLVTGSITGAALIDSAVDTPKITNNAVTVPVTMSRGSSLLGNNGYQVVVAGSITLTAPGTIFAMSTAKQIYTGIPPHAWAFRIKIGDVYLPEVWGEGSYTDPLAVSGARGGLSAGTYAIVLEWKGDPAISITSDSTFAMGILK